MVTHARKLAPGTLEPETGPFRLVAESDPNWVSGYLLPRPLLYHPGHTWARLVGRDRVIVGIDDFARQLLGEVSAVGLPAPGERLRQGEVGFRIEAGDRAAELLAPVSGLVTAANPDLAARPDLVNEDPYQSGWLVEVRSGHLAGQTRNLLVGALARCWTEDCRARLQQALVALSGSVLQEGGKPGRKLLSSLPLERWRPLAQEFFLA